jgi:hypothetical protein
LRDLAGPYAPVFTSVRGGIEVLRQIEESVHEDEGDDELLALAEDEDEMLAFEDNDDMIYH